MSINTAHSLTPPYPLLARPLLRLFSDCGIALNGSQPFDIQILDPQALRRMVHHGSLGLGESYMDGQWECSRIDQLIDRLLRHPQNRRVANSAAQRWLTLAYHLRNLQSRTRARIVGEHHYDIGNQLYEKMLDSYMNYSCGYWQTATTLEQAQQDKMELICRKLQLQAGMTVLDIGCGWGGIARYAAEHYDVRVVGITISRQQVAWANAHLDDLPVEIRCQDYRDVSGAFDRVLSVGMFEHVGYKNYPVFFQKCHELLKSDGLMLLHTIGANESRHTVDPWIHRYIFPNGMLPSIAQIGDAMEPYFVMEDWHSFGAFYDQTLMAWQRRFDSAWSQLESGYDERFRRMWNYYLFACAGAFRARDIQLWQVVLAKGGRTGVYTRPVLS